MQDFKFLLISILTIFLAFTTNSLIAQTTVLKDINPGSDDGYIDHMTVIDSVMFFIADLSDEDEGELFITDGTREGTQKISDIAPPHDYPDIEDVTPLGNKIIFTAVTDELGREPYISDGTYSGTQLIEDINPDDGYSEAEHFGVMNGKAYFPAEDGSYPDADNGEELWVSDGTSSGTYQLKDLDPGQYFQNSWSTQETNYSSRPDNFFTHGDVIYFSARHHNYGEELWITDGTSGGTHMVKDIFPGKYEDSDDIENDSSPTNFTSINGTVLFNAESDSVYKHYLYTTDGTEEGTVKFLNEEDVFIEEEPVEYSGNWYFISGTKLWKSDGTPTGTTTVIDMAEGNYVIEDGSDVSNELFKYNGQLYFFSTYTLWKTDGTQAGTEVAVESLFSLFDYHYTDFAALFNDHIYFVATDEGYGRADVAGRELWMTDGTQEGTMYVANLRTGIDRGEPDGSDPEDLRVLNGKLYFTAEGDSLGREIWMTTGIPQRSYQIKDTSLTAKFSDYGATVSFPNFTDSLHLQAFLYNNTDQESLQISDSLTLGANRVWKLETQTSSSFEATLCLSLSEVDLDSPDPANLDIIKRTGPQSDWELLAAQVDDNEEYLCAAGIQSFSEFTIVETPGNDLGVFTEAEETPGSFKLEKAYPNPFNPTTNIRYSIPEATDVSLKVYNIVGQKILTLVNTKQSAGNYNVTFDAHNLSSGVYFYRLEAAGKVTTNKMTLVK
jgi:ELWxxDGT repeat protein